MAVSHRSNRPRRPGRQPDDSGPNASRLRNEIDRSRTGDKVSHTDPSVAPLGTDDESAGQPPTGDQVEHALQQERGHGDAVDTASGPDTASGHHRLAGPAVWLLLIFVVAVLVVLGFVLPL